ncbi:MAG: hypothetical protein IPF46_13920 [Saprospiraceae bacterium]|nr:hypothetical protein [Candidatus Vicinibacter affinis]
MATIQYKLYTPAAGNNIPGDVHALPVVFGSQTLAAVIGVVEYLTADVHVGSTLRHATGDGTQVPGAKILSPLLVLPAIQD